MTTRRRRTALRRSLPLSALLVCLCLCACGGSPSGGPLTGGPVLDLFRAAAKSTAPDVDVLGDGKVHLLQTFTGGVRTAWTLRDSDVPLLSLTDAAGVRRITTYQKGKPARTTELSVNGSNLLSIRQTFFATSADLPDIRESWTESAGQTSVEVTREEAPAHDGQFDVVGTFTRERGDADLGVPAAGSNCSSAQGSALQDAIKAMVPAAFDCLQGLDRSLALRMAQAVATFNYAVLCGGPSSTLNGLFEQGLDGRGGGTILVYDGAFSAGELAQTLLHELLHDKALLGSHQNGNPDSDPGDRVYGCARACFAKSGSSISCAACGLVPNGDPKCNGYRQASCAAVTYCSCNNSFYTDEQACTAACKADLSCSFGNVCGPVTAGETAGVCP